MILFGKPLSHPLTFSYFLLLFIGLTLPSDGSHGLLSPKGLVFLSSVFSGFLAFFLKKDFSFKTFQLLHFFLAFSFFSLLFITVGLQVSPHEEFVFDQFKLFVITFAVIALTFFYVFENLLQATSILKSILYFNFFYSTVKVTLFALHLLHIINIWKILDFFGIRYMSMGILGILERFQTSVDVATPFFIFFMLTSNLLHIPFSKKFKGVYFLISTLSIFLSFSRFFIFIGIISVGLYTLTLNLTKKMKFFTLCFFALLGIMGAIGYERSLLIIEKRFFSTDTQASDHTRIDQIKALLQESEKWPLLGKGFGGYTPDVKRDALIPYSYEVQWVAFLLQFGYIGIFLLLSFLLLIPYQILNLSTPKIKLPLFLLFILWLLAGFTNPFLISLTSGIIYSMFLLPCYIIPRPCFTKQSIFLTNVKQP